MVSKKKVYFLTRSFPPEVNSGGSIVRWQTVDLLEKEGFDVTVVVFTCNTEIWHEYENVLAIHVNPRWFKLMMLLEHCGIVDDFLAMWVPGAVDRLSKKIKKDDLIFSTSGGDLGCLIVAEKLKKITGCKSVANLHDPINYSTVLGERYSNRPHVSRDKVVSRILSSFDKVYTSSSIYADYLSGILPSVDIENWYFGYSGGTKVRNVDNTSNGGMINLVYAGNFSHVQSPHLLMEEMLERECFISVNFHFIGSGCNQSLIESYANKYSNVYYHGKKEQHEVHDFYMKHADFGLVSLVGDYFKPFVPSKLYDYIQYGLPIVANVPLGDAHHIVRNNGIGISSNSVKDLADELEAVVNSHEQYLRFIKNVERIKDDWEISKTSVSMIKYLKGL